MKFQVGDEVTFYHWGNLGRIVGVIDEIQRSIIIRVGTKRFILPLGDKDLCLKVLFDSPLMKELS